MTRYLDGFEVEHEVVQALRRRGVVAERRDSLRYAHFNNNYRAQYPDIFGIGRLLGRIGMFNVEVKYFSNGPPLFRKTGERKYSFQAKQLTDYRLIESKTGDPTLLMCVDPHGLWARWYDELGVGQRGSVNGTEKVFYVASDFRFFAHRLDAR